MEKLLKDIGRREILRRFSYGLTGAGAVMAAGCSAGLKGIPAVRALPPEEPPETRVSVVRGTDRRQMIADTLQPFKEDIRKAIIGKQVLIKINCNRPDDQLIKTHPDAVRGVLDVIIPMYDRQILVGESTALEVPTEQTYNRFGYFALEKEFNVKMVELNDDDMTYTWILDRDLFPERIGIINRMIDPNVYIISVTMLKTHDSAITTLCLKNVVMGSPLKNPKRGINYKTRMHGYGRPGTQSYPGSPKLLNLNIFKIAQVARPDLCVLDGLVGAEGDGPNKCTPVDHKIALAGTDFVAVDSIGSELMGVPREKIGYLRHCAEGGLGQWNRDKIKIIGPDPTQYVIPYKLHSRVDWQKQWDISIDWNLIHPRE